MTRKRALLAYAGSNSVPNICLTLRGRKAILPAAEKAVRWQRQGRRNNLFCDLDDSRSDPVVFSALPAKSRQLSRPKGEAWQRNRRMALCRSSMTIHSHRSGD
jgi:hypothetical protein